MTMFGIKKNAKILELDGWSSSPTWTHDTFRVAAQAKLKTTVNDVGELAAALGYDAVITKRSAGNWNQDFWIILNRSKVVAVEGGMQKTFPKDASIGDQGGIPGVRVKKPKNQKKLDYTNADAVLAEQNSFGGDAGSTLSKMLDLAPNSPYNELKEAVKADKTNVKAIHKELKKQLKAVTKLDDYRQTESFAELVELVDDLLL
jgi:hypothetical protein